MKKLLISFLLVFVISGMAFATRAIDWTTSGEANVNLYMPSAGIFMDNGARELYITTSNTNATFELTYYNSTATVAMSTESIVRNVKKTLLNPYFRIRAVSSEAVLLSAEVYILN